MFDCDTNYIELEVEGNRKVVISFDIEDINSNINMLYESMNFLLEHDIPIDMETMELFHQLIDLKYGFLTPLMHIYNKYLKEDGKVEIPMYQHDMRETFTVMSEEKFRANYGEDFPILRR